MSFPGQKYPGQWLTILIFAAVFAIFAGTANGIIVSVDYTYDTNNFFDTPAKKAAMQVAADRFSSVISSNLLAVAPSSWRIGFSHPGSGASYQVSTAANSGSDPLIGGTTVAADVYGFGGLTTDTWVLYAGGRSLGGPAAVGGTGTGSNFLSTFTDPNGPMHRGLISETPGSTTDTVSDLPAWGGSISFESSLSWHFDTTTVAPGGTVDFYSIALHEIGHALGLSLSFNQWEQFDTGGTFTGPEALAAYNADNGTSLTALNQVSGTNEHWEDGTYDSEIFPAGNPNYVGTVGEGNLQDLLMEPIANFTGSIRRLELTNVDAAALRDLGWQTAAVPESSAFLFLAMVGAITGVRRLAAHRAIKQAV